MNRYTKKEVESMSVEEIVNLLNARADEHFVCICRHCASYNYDCFGLWLRTHKHK